MAAYFQLNNLTTGESTKFSVIDEEICAYLHQTPDEDKYILGWYDAIGFRVATGKSFDEVIETFRGYIDDARTKSGATEDEKVQSTCDRQELYYLRLIDIVNFLKTKYTTNAWSGR